MVIYSSCQYECKLCLNMNVNYFECNSVLSLITGYAGYLSVHCLRVQLTSAAYVCRSRHHVLPHSPSFSFLVACSDPFAHLLFDYLPS
jgi:hypothetical protein